MRGQVTPGPGFIAFATKDKGNAERFLESPAYKFLSVAAKEYVLQNLNCGIRVQDPNMHPSPHLMFEGSDAEKHYKKVLSLL